MFCDEALDAVEAIAAGELTPEAASPRTSRPARIARGARAGARLELLLRAAPCRAAGAVHSRTMAGSVARAGAPINFSTWASISRSPRRARGFRRRVAADAPHGLAAVSSDA